MQRDFEAIALRLQNERQLTAARAARLVPAERGRHGYCSASTLVRWILRGKRGVFLDGYRGAGTSWWTSREALARFFAALSEIEAGNQPVEVITTHQQKRAAAAAVELERLLRSS